MAIDEMKADIEKRYFDWLYELVCGKWEPRNLSFHRLLTFLYDTQFIPDNEMDCNRAVDGENLRDRFLDQQNDILAKDSLLDSASRHLAKYMVGMDDEDHLRAACWNLLWALNQRVMHPELDDRFVPKMKSSNNEPIITVVCSSCGSHFEAPTEWWVRKRAQYTNIPDGVITTCPHCGNATIVREVKPDE